LVGAEWNLGSAIVGGNLIADVNSGYHDQWDDQPVKKKFEVIHWSASFGECDQD
jgi:hypothetical protein